MDLVDERREEIQNIIRKRQRKAALDDLVKRSDLMGKATMTGLIQRSKEVKESLLLPEIGKKVETEYNSKPAPAAAGDGSE